MNPPFFPSLFAISLGAVLGASARWLLGLWLNPLTSALPCGTLAANWLGAILIGLAAGAADLFPALPPYWKLWFVTGLLGSLTTFSGFSLEIVGMLQAQRFLQAALAAMLHVFGSLLLTAAGLQLMRFCCKQVS
ncbi:MAG: fluoride efflux transporter CrcB [Neisseria sp.]|nr:fluoride efflux transporter CrcB [Neisseria sp.]